jgi:hypothetical protein
MEAVVTCPASVRVGPYRYKVVVSAERIKELEKESNSELYGITTHGHLEIALQPDVADLILRETLLHEVLHAVLYNTGLSDRMSDKAEEHLIRGLSPALFALLRDNPDLVAYLVGGDEQ